MSDLNHVRAMAAALLAEHLSEEWTFGFDTAKRRAGRCDFRERRITLSRYLASRYDDATNRQTLLHEIAHALAGHAAGHGPHWRRIARAIGYTGGTTHDGEIAREHAKWVGVCPAGHEVFRFRRPDARRQHSCARCSPRFDRRFALRWRERTPEEREADLPAAAGRA